MSQRSPHRPDTCSRCAGCCYAVPLIGHRPCSLQIHHRLRISYWRGLLNPALRQLPEIMLASQLEEVQAALRDALHLLRESGHE